MRVRLKGINSKRKRLADGSLKIYFSAWKGGPPLRVTEHRSRERVAWIDYHKVGARLQI
jgi:hypothetical protein